MKLLDLTTGIEENKDKNKSNKNYTPKLPTIETSAVTNGVSLLPEVLLSNRSIKQSKFTKLSSDHILLGNITDKESKS